jgi:serine/threonine protein kinase
MSIPKLLNNSDNEFLGEGSYGCVYNPGITCKGKKNKAKTVTKIQEINFFSNNEKNIGAYIKTHIKNYKNYFCPIIKSCIVKFNTIEKSDLDIKKCTVIFDEYDNEQITKPVPQYNQYILMHSPYIKSYTMKAFYIDNKFVYVSNILNHIYKIIYAINLLTQVGIVHNDLHMGNVLINLTNLNPIIIDFGLSLNINNCYKLNKDYVDFQYIKKFTYDFRSDSYHFNIEKRFISFIIHNKTQFFPNEIYDNNEDNNISKEAINYFINDAYTSINNNPEIRYYFSTNEMAEYRKALEQFYYQFLDKQHYPKYNTIVKYLLHYMHINTDLYSLTINLLYLSYLKHNTNTGTLSLNPEELVILDFFTQLYKKNLYPDPKMRLKATELQDIYKYIINFIMNYNLKTTKNSIKVDFITAFVKFLKSKNISIKTLFYKNFAFLNFNLICTESIFQTIKSTAVKL